MRTSALNHSEVTAKRLEAILDDLSEFAGVPRATLPRDALDARKHVHDTEVHIPW